MIATGMLAALVSAQVAFPAASTLDLPSHHEIETGAVEIAVSEIDISITRSEEHAPSLDIRAIDPDRTTSVEMTVTEVDGVLLVSSPQATNARPGVALELTLPPGFPLRIAGSDLRIERVTEVSRNADPSAALPMAALDAMPETYDLQTGSLNFSGPGAAYFQGSNNDFTLTGTSGTHVFQTYHGTISITAHQGSLDLEANGTPTSVESAGGKIKVQISNSRFSLSEGTGSAELILADSSAFIREHTGNLTLNGTLSDIRVLHGRFQRFNLTGNDTTAWISESGGLGMITLVGGSLDIDHWTDRLTVRVRNYADLALANIDGDTAVTISEDASGSIDTVTGHCRANVVNGNLEVSNLKSLELTAVDSTITASEVPVLTSLKVTDGELDLATTRLQGKPMLQLSGSARAFLEIPSPCTILVKGPEADSAYVDVRDCDLNDGSIIVSSRRKQKRVTRRSITLTADMGPDAELRVEGRIR